MDTITALDRDRFSARTADLLTLGRADSYVKWLSCLYQSNDSPSGAAMLFKLAWPRSLDLDLIEKGAAWQLQYGSSQFASKAAVNPGTTVEPAFAAPLSPLQPLEQAIVDLARPQSLLGKLTAAVRAPFNVSIPVQTGGGTYRWRGQGHATPAGQLALSSATLPILAAGGIHVVTAELMKVTSPASAAFLRNELIRGITYYLDQQLCDHTVAAVANVSPASITNGAPSIASAGTSAANALTDIKLLLATFTAANPNTETLVLLMSPAVAVAVAVAATTDTLGPDGGTLFGVPVLTSTGVGSRLIALDPTALLVADDGGLDVSIARNATVELDTAGASPQGASTVLISLWTSNLVGLKITRFISWRMARNNSVLYTNVSYV
jgi:hypothetical protein